MFDDLQIVIPSRSRANVQKTIYNMSENLWPNTSIVVPEEQYHQYYHAVPSPIAVIPCTEYGIAPTRRFILNLKPTGKLIMADDDLTFYKRTADGRKFYIIKGEYTEEMFAAFVDYLDRYVIVGIADKLFSHTLPRGYKECTRFNDIHGYNRDLFPTPGFEYRGLIGHGEEHDIQLQAITRGYRTCCITEYSKTNKTFAKGGCSDWRDKETAQRELLLFAARWPDIVKVTLDPNHPLGCKASFNWKMAKKIGGID